MAIQPDFAGHVNEHNDNADNNVAGEAAGDGFHQTINEYAQDHNRQGGEQIKDFAT
ncbi:MAG TPA: hypothetical protein VLA74_04020 [Nitrososphaeraceae archaeon]|nr:hypothetical protein [Nitrososphaeraceae archaeon]